MSAAPSSLHFRHVGTHQADVGSSRMRLTARSAHSTLLHRWRQAPLCRALVVTPIELNQRIRTPHTGLGLGRVRVSISTDGVMQRYAKQLPYLAASASGNERIVGHLRWAIHDYFWTIEMSKRWSELYKHKFRVVVIQIFNLTAFNKAKAREQLAHRDVRSICRREQFS